MTQNHAYWLRWAYQRGQHHYAERDPWDSAESAAALITNDPDQRAEAIRGWCDAARGSTDPRPDPRTHPEYWTE